MDNTCKAVLFDLDGTLIDTYQLILESFRHATRKVLGRVIPDEQLMVKVGRRYPRKYGIGRTIRKSTTKF